jgi:hypothetical protein
MNETLESEKENGEVRRWGEGKVKWGERGEKSEELCEVKVERSMVWWGRGVDNGMVRKRSGQWYGEEEERTMVWWGRGEDNGMVRKRSGQWYGEEEEWTMVWWGRGVDNGMVWKRSGQWYGEEEEWTMVWWGRGVDNGKAKCGEVKAERTRTDGRLWKGNRNKKWKRNRIKERTLILTSPSTRCIPCKWSSLMRLLPL